MLQDADYYFAHDELLVLPPEHLRETGLSDELRAELLRRELVSPAWCDAFDRAFEAAWTRLDELHRRLPREWFPPRLQHVCLVRRDAGRAPVRPYFQPFHRMAWLLEESDFDPERSSHELAVAQILLVARTGVLQQVAPAYVHNLGYWLLRSDEELDDYLRGCARSPRPDIEAARAQGELARRRRELFHVELRPPRVDSGERLLAVPETGLVADAALYEELQGMAQRCAEVVRVVARDYYAQFGQPDTAAGLRLAEWLCAERPRVVITGGKDARILWDGDTNAEPEDVARALGPLSAAGAESIRADLEVISRISTSFVASLRDPGSLPAPDEEHADQNGLSYMHLDRREIAYNLDESGMRRRLEPAPPYERLMLGARTAHEWAHLATEAGWVDVPASRADDQRRAQEELVECFERVLSSAPSSLLAGCAPGFERSLEHGLGSAARELAAFSLSRVEDFQSNLLASRYLTPSERETYVRNNLRSHTGELAPEHRFHLLARYLYELQYLRFSFVADPWSYLVGTTWFREELVAPGFVTEEAARELAVAIGRSCDLYEVDETRFDGVSVPQRGE